MARHSSAASLPLMTIAVAALVLGEPVLTDRAVALAQAAGQAAAQPVSVLQLQKEIITRREVLPGRVTAFRKAEIRPQVAGIVQERLFAEGSAVTKGQQLYQIDPAQYEAQLKSARAYLRAAQANAHNLNQKMARYNKLVKVNAISRQQADDVQAELAAANAEIAVQRAAIDIAQLTLDYTKVNAPIAGRIGRSQVTEGALVTANQTTALATVTQLDPIYVDMNQPGVEAMRLRPRIASLKEVPVNVIVDSETDLRHDRQGKLTFSDISVDETTGAIGMRAIIPNPEESLLPGMFVYAEMLLGDEEVVLVPQRAAIRNPRGGLTVWVVDAENKVAPRPVQATRAWKDYWIVDEGLDGTETIVVEGYIKIGPGSVVAPTPWAEPEREKRLVSDQAAPAAISQPADLPADTPVTDGQVTDEPVSGDEQAATGPDADMPAEDGSPDASAPAEEAADGVALPTSRPDEVPEEAAGQETAEQ